jgi:hypothetical protein
LGYKKSDFISPTLVQNFVNNYKFESTGGWYASSSTNRSSKDKPSVQNVYGRFLEKKNGKAFTTILEDFEQGVYSEENHYIPYMKISLHDKN